MKKKIGIVASIMFAFLISSSMLSAQYYDDFGQSCEYDDQIVIINDYNNNANYNGNRGKRRSSVIRQERRWKAKILQRAYAIAEADGRVTRRERREINKLERDLGIYRNGRGNRGRRNNNTRNYNGR